MDTEKYHNKLVNSDRVEACTTCSSEKNTRREFSEGKHPTFTDADYKGDLEPNEVFAIGLAVTQGKRSGLKEWLLRDYRISEVKNLETASRSNIHVMTNRATYVFEYDSDDYTWNSIHIPVVCKITAKEFSVEPGQVPDPVLERSDDKLYELKEEARKSV